MAGGSGILIVLLVVFVGIFLLALALPACWPNQDSFLFSRNWVVGGDELALRHRRPALDHRARSVLAMVIAVPIAIGVALFLTQYLPKRPPARCPSWSTCSPRYRRSSSACGD